MNASAHNSVEAFLYHFIGGKKMTEKELLYVEDALGHATFLSDLANTAVSQLSDAELKSKAQEVASKMSDIFYGFYDLV